MQIYTLPTKENNQNSLQQFNQIVVVMDVIIRKNTYIKIVLKHLL